MTDQPLSTGDGRQSAPREGPVARALRSPWFLPAVVGLLALRVVHFAASEVIHDPDVWWVAAAGRDMLRTGHVPTANLWSFVDTAHPWVMHEWLFAVPYEVLLTRFGPHAFALVAALGSVATLAPVIASVSRARHALTVVFAVFLSTLIFEQRMVTPRVPHVALAFATATAALAFRERFDRRHVVFAAVLSLLWTNSHGSFVLGIGLLVAGAFGAEMGRGDRRNRIAGALVFALVTLINPYGLRLHALVASYLFGTGEVMDLVHGHIIEFSWIGKAIAKGYLDPERFVGLLVVVALAVFALTRREMRVRGLTVLALCVMTVRQLRHLELAGLVGMTLLWPAVDSILDRTRWRRRDDRLLQRVHPYLAGLLVVAAFAFHGLALAWRPRDQWVDDENLGGRHLPALVAEIPDGARVYSTFVQTGVLIWHGWPRGIRVLYDLRNDCYGRQAALDAIALQKPRDGAGVPLEALARNRVDRVIVKSDHPLAGILRESPRWAVVDRSGEWMLFAAATR